MGKCAVVMQCEALIRTLLCLSEFQARALAVHFSIIFSFSSQRARFSFYLFSNHNLTGNTRGEGAFLFIFFLVMALLNSDRATLRISGPQRKESSPEGTYPLKESA